MLPNTHKVSLFSTHPDASTWNMEPRLPKQCVTVTIDFDQIPVVTRMITSFTRQRRFHRRFSTPLNRRSGSKEKPWSRPPLKFLSQCKYILDWILGRPSQEGREAVSDILRGGALIEYTGGNRSPFLHWSFFR